MPIYPIQRVNTITGEVFNDRSHILYVNGQYRGDSDIGWLMHDFNCTEAKDMHFSLLAEKTRYLKETQEGVRQMCKAMEEMRNRSMLEGMAAVVIQYMKVMGVDAKTALAKLQIEPDQQESLLPLLTTA